MFKVYDRLLQQTDERDWPQAGDVYVAPDGQQRCGPGSWVVAVMGDGTFEGDTEQLGIFWHKGNAMLFARAYEEQCAAGQGEAVENIA